MDFGSNKNLARIVWFKVLERGLNLVTLFLQGTDSFCNSLNLGKLFGFPFKKFRENFCGLSSFLIHTLTGEMLVFRKILRAY